MTGLVRAEWLKIINQNITRILALMLLGLAALMPFLAVTNVTGNGSHQFRQDSFTRLNFMDAILFILSGLTNIGGIIVSVMIAAVIGNEYSQDTWKNLLTWQNGRIRFLAAKLIVAWPVIIVMFLLALLATGAIASVGHALVASTAAQAGLADTPRTVDQFFKEFYENGVVVLLQFTVITSLTTFMTVLTRSTVAGVMIVLVWQIGETISLRLLPDILKNLTMVVNLTSLNQNLAKAGSGSIEVWQSLVVIGAYIVIPLVAALVIFRQRDIEGN